MENKYKVAVAASFIPALVNIAGSVYVFMNFSMFQFSGYLTGTILGIILSVMWLMQVRKAFGSHAIKLLKVTFKAFFLKFLVFLIFIAGVYYLYNFSRTFFAASFFISLSLSAVIEIWFYASLNKANS